jgi:hypothetical protein
MKSAKTVAELASLLKAAAWHSKLLPTVEAKFLASIRYGELREGNGYTCVGQIGAKACVEGGGYCSSAYCH